MGGAELNRQEIDLNSLRKLQDWFGEDGELEESEFVEAFGSILGSNLTKEQLTHLFMKIDANSDGSVDWDEFTNYMFLGNADARDVSAAITEGFNSFYLQIGDTVFDSNNSHRQLHREPIIKIGWIEKTQQLFTVGKDAVVRLWNPLNLLHITSLKLDVFQPHSRHATDKVTASVYLQSANLLAVATIGNGVSFFEILSDNCKKSAHISSQALGYASAICLDVYYDKQKKREILHIGCDDGRIHCFPSVDRLIASGDTAHGEFPVHSDHITRIQYLPDLAAAVSASLDTTIKVVNVETGQVKRVFTGHKKAVYDFAWCPSVKAIASCGVERQVMIWSPYSQRTIAVFHGHLSSVKQVAFSPENDELISLALDNTIKVWDMRSHRCLQTFESQPESTVAGRYSSRSKTRNRSTDRSVGISTLAVLPNIPCFYTGGSKLKLWPLKRLVCTQEAAYRPPIVGVLYNPSFDQVVTADEDAYVSVWSLKDGRMISKFRASGSVTMKPDQLQKSADTDLSGCNTYELKLPLRKTKTGKMKGGPKGGQLQRLEDGVESAGVSFETIAENLEPSREMDANEPNITCMCFDAGGRRLITGSSAGEALKVWNFSNGCLLQELSKDLPAELDESEDTSDAHAHPCAVIPNNMARESTGVIYLQQSALGGDSKFVVSVGWDRQVYIWADGVDPGAKVVGFCKTLPEPQRKRLDAHRSIKQVRRTTTTNRSLSKARNVSSKSSGNIDNNGKSIVDGNGGNQRGSGNSASDSGVSGNSGTGVISGNRGRKHSVASGHSSDILCVAHVPPSMIATGGSDGLVFVWNVNTGRVLVRIGVGERVEGLCYLPKKDLLVTSKTDGVADFISVRHRMLIDSVRVTFDTKEPIAMICSDHANDTLITADHRSNIKVWSLELDAESPYWESCIVRLLAAWSAGDSILTAMEHIEARTLLETFVVIGQHNGIVSTWTLSGEKVGNFGQRSPWDLVDIQLKTDAFVDPASIDYSLINTVDFQQRCARLKLQMCASKETPRDPQGGAGTPEVGEVWSRTDCKGQHLAVITITQIKEEQIVGTDGDKNERKMSVDQLVAGDMPFRRDRLLSAYIGCVFDQSFKVLYVVLRDGECRVVDTSYKEHPMPNMPQSTRSSTSLSVSAMRAFQLRHSSCSKSADEEVLPSLPLTDAFAKADVEIAPRGLELDCEQPMLETIDSCRSKDGFSPRPPEKPLPVGGLKAGPLSIHRLLKKRMFGKTESGKSLLAHRRRIHKMADLPLDFKQLRANLSIKSSLDGSQRKA